MDRDFALRIASVIIFVVMSLVGVGISYYLVVTSKTPLLFWLAISFLILSIVSGIFNVTSAYSYYRSYFYDRHLAEINKGLKPLKRLPSVAIAIPTYNEDPKLVEKTLLSMKKMDYDPKKMKIYLLDDSTKPEIKNELENFCKQEGVEYLHREERKGFKAGAINNFLKYSKEEFVAVFDADERLTNNKFLKDLLPYFQDEKLSFIQTEKRYDKGNFFSSCVDLFDAFFFKFIQPSRALNNTAIFAGSCGIIRRSALDAIGGFPEYVIEDTFFSFESDMKGYRSLYIPKVYALGAPITSFTALSKQQWRYNYGDTQFMLHLLRNMKKHKKRTVSALSKIDYALHGLGLNYLSIILIMFTVISLVSVFASAPITYETISQLVHFKLPSLNFELFGLNAFLLSILVPIAITKLYFNSISKGFMIFVLNFALAFVRLKAAIAAVFNLSPVTGWVKGITLRGRFLAALKNSLLEVLFSIVLFIAGVFAILTANLTGALWLLWYGFLYSSTFIFFYRYG